MGHTPSTLLSPAPPPTRSSGSPVPRKIIGACVAETALSAPPPLACPSGWRRKKEGSGGRARRLDERGVGGARWNGNAPRKGG